MNSKRRAELHRKLALKAVPRPPAGLRERIKADIPNYLERESDSARFTRTIAFPMRVAASILLLITSLLVTVYLITPAAEQEQAAAVAASGPGPFAPAPRALRDTAAAAPTEEVRLEITQEAPAAVPQFASADIAPSRAAAPAREARRAERTIVERDEAATGQSGGSVGAIDGTPLQIAEAAPPPPPPAMPAPAPPAAPAAADAARFAVTANAPVASPSPAAESRAAKEEAGATLFGISVNPDVFHRIRATLEAGGRPAATAVDVEALVNYFAGAPDSRPRRGVRLEVEASPAAVEAEGDHAVLRFTVDTAAASRPAPAASNARLDVTFNPEVVAQARRMGNSDALAAESVLQHGVSVTGLYALELRPNLKSSQLVATVTLQYTSPADGRRQTITRRVFGGDLAGSWRRATRRHRLASLGAVWGESLKGTAAGFDVARRAEELVTQNPNDARARELAAAASASGGASR